MVSGMDGHQLRALELALDEALDRLNAALEMSQSGELNDEANRGYLEVCRLEDVVVRMG